MALSLLLLRRTKFPKYPFSPLEPPFYSCLSSAALDSGQPPPPPATTTKPPTSLSARMSFVFAQMDAIDKQREEKDQTLQRIRAWRESKKLQNNSTTHPESAESTQPEPSESTRPESTESPPQLDSPSPKSVVELAHPWPEWIELMERLVHQNYFDHKRKDEDGMFERLGFDAPINEDKGIDGHIDFTRDFKTVQTAILNFGRDRFDILRSLSRNDLQTLVGHGCPSADKRVVFSAKVLRKLVHLDEGDVCSSCNLRSSCEKAYLLTNKEDEARTMDIMRVLLTYGFDPINGSVTNKSLLKLKSVKTVIRKLLHEIVKLSAVPIDPNLPPPILKKPPPKVKQPPPPPKKRVGRDDVEMKKGDWLCPKCDFMNFAKNTVCLQCDAKRPKRQLLPGEWECPECNFLNYRRNTVCFHCEHKRPPDTYMENQLPERRHGPRMMRPKKIPSRDEVSNAWNFDFDDNESDGADVAAFEYADSQRPGKNFPNDRRALEEDDFSNKPQRMYDREYSGPMKPGTGFDDFDDDEEDDIDGYELDTRNEVNKTSKINFSELEIDSESEDEEGSNGNWHARDGTRPLTRKGKGSDDDVDGIDFDSDDDLPVHPNWKSSHVANMRPKSRDRGSLSFGLDDEIEMSSGSEDERFTSRQNKGKRGGRAYNRAGFSSDDDLGHHGDKRRGGKSGVRGQEKFSRGHGNNSQNDDFDRFSGSRDINGYNRAGFDSDDDFSGYHGDKRRDSKARDDKRRGQEQLLRGRGKSSRNDDFDRFSGPRANGYDGRRGNDRDGGFSRSRGNRPGGSGSFKKRGGRSDSSDNRSDSYLDDARYSRPRINVR